MPDKYSIRFYCVNCGRIGRMEFKFGDPVWLRDKPCPDCGCKTLKQRYENWGDE